MIVGINGFGRIGKNVYRILVKNGIRVSLINDPFIDIEYLAYLLKHDSVYYNERIAVEIKGNSIIYDGVETKLTNKTDPSEIQWNAHGVDCVVEATGQFTERADAHNCKTVVVTSPSETAPMFVYGVNHEKLEHNQPKVISCASCTTNCLAPIAKYLHEKYTIKNALMTTVHSVTATQKTCDTNGKNRRTARSCFNIIPSTTGAARCVTDIIPELSGKIDGMCFRVPVSNVSVVDLTVEIESPTSLEEIANGFKNYNPRIFGITESELVSSDLIGNSLSCILDVNASMMLNDRFFKLVCWYDNEHAYSCRVVDILLFIDSFNKH